MNHRTTIRAAVYALFAVGTISEGSLIDPLDDLSNFGTPLNAALVAAPAGEASLTADAPSVDRLVDWQISGTTHLDLIDEGYVTVTPANQINSGEWGLWGLYYTSSGSFLTETNILAFTNSASMVSIDMMDFAPPTADEYTLRFRIREATGDGFSFTQINATPVTPVPEPATFFVIAPIFIALLLRQHLRKRCA